jgi:Family of unknown function (DUF6152)
VALFCAALGGAFSFPLSAHHSFAAEFDAAKPVTLEGTVARLEWTNPHAWLYVNVTGRNGAPVLWAFELSAPTALARRGLSPQTAPPGSKVVVKGYAAKNGTSAARGWWMRLSDGRELELTKELSGNN